MAQDYSPIGHCGAIDANMYQILEPLTRIWIKMWSHWRQLGSHSGAIDADMDPNLEPLTPSCFGLARKFKPGGLFKWGKKNSTEFFNDIIVLRGSTVPSFLYKSNWGDILAGSVNMTAQIQSVPASMSCIFCYCACEFILGHPRGLSENDSKSCCHFKKAREDVPIQGFTALWTPNWSTLNEWNCVERVYCDYWGFQN